MTPQEQDLLKGLTDRINQTVLSEKDPDAENFIQQSLSRNPDALYILAQTVLVQQYALDQAKSQLDQAKLDLDHARQQAQQPRPTTSFLGNLLGHNDPPPPPPPSQAQYQPVPNYAPPPYQQYAQPAAYGAPIGYGSPQSGGFLRSAMQTATGVAAGALAFEGIESLMHGFDLHAGYGSGFEGMGSGIGGGRPEEIINNNYYGDAKPDQHGDLSDRLSAAGDQPSPDIEDRRDASSTNFADTNDTDAFAQDDNDSSLFDNSSDDSTSDFGGGDDSGGSDDFSS